MRKIILMLVICIVITGCGKREAEEKIVEKTKAEKIGAEERLRVLTQKVERIEKKLEESKEEANPLEDIHVEGIAYEPQGNSMVMINGEILYEGDDVEGFKIEKINEQDIILTKEEVEYSVKIKSKASKAGDSTVQPANQPKRSKKKSSSEHVSPGEQHYNNAIRYYNSAESEYGAIYARPPLGTFLKYLEYHEKTVREAQFALESYYCRGNATRIKRMEDIITKSRELAWSRQEAREKSKREREEEYEANRKKIEEEKGFEAPKFEGPKF